MCVCSKCGAEMSELKGTLDTLGVRFPCKRCRQHTTYRPLPPKTPTPPETPLPIDSRLPSSRLPLPDGGSVKYRSYRVRKCRVCGISTDPDHFIGLIRSGLNP